MSDKGADIALAAWGHYQRLVKDAADAIWKVRAFYSAMTFALFGSAFSSGNVVLYLFALPAGVICMLLEAGPRRIQWQYIRKSIQIERTLTDLLVEEPQPFVPEGGISTELDTPTLQDLLELFRLKRYLFWSPYLVVSLVGGLLCLFGVAS